MEKKAVEGDIHQGGVSGDGEGCKPGGEREAKERLKLTIKG